MRKLSHVCFQMCSCCAQMIAWLAAGQRCVCVRAYVCIVMPVLVLFEHARTHREASNTWNATLAVGV